MDPDHPIPAIQVSVISLHKALDYEKTIGCRLLTVHDVPHVLQISVGSARPFRACNCRGLFTFDLIFSLFLDNRNPLLLRSEVRVEISEMKSGSFLL